MHAFALAAVYPIYSGALVDKLGIMKFGLQICPVWPPVLDLKFVLCNTHTTHTPYPTPPTPYPPTHHPHPPPRPLHTYTQPKRKKDLNTVVLNLWDPGMDGR